MSTLFSSLSTSSGALAAYERALDVSQNNVSNASTSGYAAQNVDFQALSFDPGSGRSGGITAHISSARDAYADESVRREVSKQGTADQLSTSLTGLQNEFDITGQTGVSAGLSKLLNSFSALSVSSNNQSARQDVISGATAVVESFQQLASSLSTQSSTAESQIQSNVAQINSIAAQIQGYNAERIQSGVSDAGVDAQLSAALERLSNIANISASTAKDGTTTVLLGGQTPLVIGSQTFSIKSAYAPASSNPPDANPSAAPAIQIQDAQGRNVTAQVTQGTLAGVLQVRNVILPSIQGDRSQQGSLNQLAQGFADRVNGLLTSGNISDGPPVQPGVALFTYNAASPTAIAQSLAVNPAISASTIATIDPGPPESSNGIATKLANIASGTNAADQISGVAFAAFFGQIAAGLGSQLSDAQSNSDLQQQTVTQARSLQSQLSGVSLDTEAVRLVQYQKAYDATAKLINVLDQVTQSALSIITTQ